MTAVFGYSKTNAAQRPRAVVSDAALDDLVEFAAIEPDPTTLRAIVDLDALPLAHDEIDAACRAQQPLGRPAIYHDGFLLTNIAPPVVCGSASGRQVGRESGREGMGRYVLSQGVAG